MFLKTSTVFAASVMMISSPAFSADQNTYRAGAPYLKVVAQSHTQCETQCRGDAQCRGWNFIRTNAGALSGICEFNSRVARPVASPVSISGINGSKVDTLMSRAVQGGAHTVRVGAPQTMAVPQTSGKNRPRRIIKREPIPQNPGYQQRASYQTQSNRPAPSQVPSQASSQVPSQANPRAPRVYGGAQAQHPRQAVQQAPMPPQRPAAAPGNSARGANHALSQEQYYYRQQYLAAQHRQQQLAARAKARPMPMPPTGYGQTPPAAMQRQPLPQSAPNGGYAQAPRAPMAPMIAQTPATRRSLYGSLYDDLTPVPRPKTAPDQPQNPDAPMSTSRAVPTKPVASAPIAPAIPGLAGATQ